MQEKCQKYCWDKSRQVVNFLSSIVLDLWPYQGHQKVIHAINNVGPLNIAKIKLSKSITNVNCQESSKARNMYKIFSLIPSKKPVTRENWDKLRVHISLFEWWNLQLYQKSQLALCSQFVKIGVVVNFIIEKLKVKT